MSELFRYFICVLIPIIFTLPVEALYLPPDKFVWGSVGDSWASGVSYSPPATDYDNNKNGCLRWKDSYGPLMEADKTWTVKPQTFHFAACSGARVQNIVAEAELGNPPQMDQVGNPIMITYHAGGNNCGFADVITNCVYQPPRKEDYGAVYPDPSGACAHAITTSHSYIQDVGFNGFYQQELRTISSLLGHPSVKDNADFKLYILGYVPFFNPGDNYCNDLSFAPFARIPGQNNPKLTVALRTDINSAVDQVNAVLTRVATDIKDPRVRFLDISPAFNGHRFCEGNHNAQDQWYNSDVWIWNLNIPSNDPPADPSLIDAWIADGTIGGVPFNFTGGGIAVEGSGGGDGGLPTWTMRPFHPKLGGTTAIKNIIVAAAKADKVPGVVGTAVPNGPPSGPCNGSFFMTVTCKVRRALRL